MRKMAVLLAAGLMAAGYGARAHGFDGVRGNDVAGIIPWSLEAEIRAVEIAAAHCARYNKVAIVTARSREPGDYINFICTFVRNGRPVRY
jgi:hypothetical protein